MGGVLIAQDKEVPLHKFQINGLFRNEGGPTALGTSGYGGVHYTGYLSKNIGIEVGAGVFQAGSKFQLYPSQIERGKVKFYIGLGGAWTYYNPSTIMRTNWLSYIPIGATWFTNRRWNFSADIGPAYLDFVDPNTTSNKIGLHFGIKAGYRFTFVRFKNRDKYIDPDSIPDSN